MRSAALITLLPLALAVPSRRAPLYTRDGDITNKYIIKINSDGSSSASIESAISSMAEHAGHIYANVGGFSATLSPEEVENLRNNPSVSACNWAAILGMSHDLSK